MLQQYLIFQLLLIPFWIDMCVGQIVFEEPDRRPSDTICTTPDGKRGNCERWTKCQTLISRISAWNELRPYLCGFAGTEPKVCCPSFRVSNILGSPARSPTSSGTNNPGSENGFSIPRTNPTRTPVTSEGKSSFLPEECGSSIFAHNRVIGGHVSDKGSWPWMAVIFRVRRNGSKRFDCGGALVTARHVVTAAHCVVKLNTNIPVEAERLMVRVGVYDLSANDPDAMDIGVDAVRIHEEYDLRIHTNDIAVLRLSQPVKFSNYTSPVCLPYGSLRYEDLTEKSSTVTGFGLTSVNGSYSDVLMEVNFDIHDQEECKRIYARDLPIAKVHLCAGTLDGSKDSCQGDSGGPLVTVGPDKRFYLVGIVSFGKKCATKGYPGVYTRVTEYLDWLALNLAD